MTVGKFMVISIGGSPLRLDSHLEYLRSRPGALNGILIMGKNGGEVSEDEEQRVLLQDTVANRKWVRENSFRVISDSLVLTEETVVENEKKDSDSPLMDYLLQSNLFSEQVSVSGTKITAKIEGALHSRDLEWFKRMEYEFLLMDDGKIIFDRLS